MSSDGGRGFGDPLRGFADYPFTFEFYSEDVRDSPPARGCALYLRRHRLLVLLQVTTLGVFLHRLTRFKAD